MPDIDNKVVSISFNNKQFMRDVADTISVIEELNEATSGKKIDSSGIENLGRAFRSTTSDLTKQADSVVSAFSNIQSAANTNFQTAGIDSLRKALESTGMTATDVEDTISSLQQLSRTGLSYASDLGVSSAAQQIQNESANTRSILTQDIDDVSNSFSALEMIGIGAMIAIGEKAAEVGANALRSLTSGIRDGWGEYNALTNSTQTILVNTQRWGSTMEDVSGALEELNRYADMTTYSFSDMTRNIGYFTTAGVQLEDSVTAIRGLSNVGAMFGADAQSVARAGYQISQAMSAGVIKLMDWRSMINAGMGGQALQDELIRTAAVMSGTSVDAMNEYIDSLGGFNASLQEGWLTSDVFLEAMRVFAGQSREYYRSLTDANGERLYSDEEIDRLVKLGETATESATQVRTLQQMIDAFKESIGSGWQRTFSLIIGNLEEAKEFWTPINNILTSLVDGFFDLQTGALSLWRTLGGREQLLEGINNVLTSLSNNLGAIGRAFMNAFGNSTTMGARLMGITEALTDLSESLILSEEELGFLEDFFTGIFEPISLVVDVIFELVKALFDADDSVLNLEHSADGLYSGFAQFRHALLAILGYIGSVLKTGANFIKQSRIIRTVVQSLVKIISKTFGGLVKIISAPFVALWQVWDKYNITERLDEFATKVAAFFLPLVDAISEVNEVISDWFETFVDSISDTIKALDPIETIVRVFTSLKQLFRDLFDPTVTVSQAFSNFFDTMSTSNLAVIFEAIQSSFSNLWSTLKETAIGQWFEDLGTRIQNGAAAFAETSFGQKIIEISDALRDFLGIDTTDWTLFWDATKLMLTDVADAISTGWEKIKTFFSEVASILSDWFGLGENNEDAASVITDPVDAVNDADVGKTPTALKTFSEGIKDVAEAIKLAEEDIPDPKDSKFLAFLRAIPEKIKEVINTLADSNIAQTLGRFFTGIMEPIRDFFNESPENRNSKLFSSLSNGLEVVASFIGGIIGISDLTFSHGLFGVIGQIITGFINMLGNIDVSALAKVEGIIVILSQVAGLIFQIQLGTVLVNLAQGINAAGKGYLQTAKAATQAAKAAKWGSIASALTAFALTLIAIFAAVALIAMLIKNPDNRAPLFVAFVGMLTILVFLYAFMTKITNESKKIKPGSLKGVDQVFKGLSSVILSIVGALAAFFGVIFAIYYLTKDMTSNELKYLGIIAAIVTGVTIGIIACVGVLLETASDFMEFAARHTGDVNPEGIGKVFSGISSILISVIILVAGFFATIMAMTYFLKSLDLKEDWPELLIAFASVALLIVGAGIAVKYLIKQAEKLSSITSGIDPKNFRKAIFTMAFLMITITAVIVVLVGAMTMLAMVISNSDINPLAFVGSALLIGGILAAVILGISTILDKMKGLVGPYNVREITATFLNVILLLAAFVGGIIAMVYFGGEIANTINDMGTFLSTILSMASMMLVSIFALNWLIDTIKRVDLRSVKADRLDMLGKIMIRLGLVLAAIVAALSIMALAIGKSGFSGNMMDVALSISTMLLVIMGITSIMVALVKSGSLDQKMLSTFADAMLMVSISMSVVALALSMVMMAAANGGALIESAITLGLLFAAIAGALGIISGIAQVDKGAIITAALSLAATSASLTIIAAAFAIIANIPVEKIQKSGFVLGALFVVMSLVLGLLTGIAATGAGAGFMAIAAGIILALAASFLILGVAVEKAGNGFDLIVGALERFVDAFNNLSNLNVQGVSNRFLSIINTLKLMARGVLELAPTIGNALEIALNAVGKGISYGFASGIGEGLLALAEFIMNNAPTIVNAFTYLGQLVLTATHALMVSLKDIIVADFGPGGTVREIAMAMEDFVVWLAGNVSEWAMDIIDSFITGLASALSDQTRIERITTAIQILWLTIKKSFMDNLGFPNLQSFGASIVLKIMEGVTDYLANVVDTISAHPGLQALLQYLDLDPAEAMRNFSDIADAAGNMAYGDTWNSTSVGREISTLTSHLNDLREASENAESSLGDLTSTGIDLGSIFSGNILGSFDTSNLGSIADAISTIAGSIGSGSSGSILGNILGGFGSGIFEGITENGGLSSLLGGLDLSSALGSLIPEDITNPVITPVIDTSEFNLGLNNMESLWNSHSFDEFAIDAGNSMLLREAAEGDAATNGNVTYNFTQYNSSPEALSPIQIYRDTNNLFRAHVNS